MTDARGAEELAEQVADAVRRAVADAGKRAEEIVMEAEAEAKQIRTKAEAEAAQIRERAEADARGQIDAARKALDELGGSLAAAVEAAIPKDPTSETPEPEPEPEPEPIPEPEPERPAESPGAPEAPVTPPAPEQSTVERTSSGGNGDDAAERLVAMKLAVDGKDRAKIEAELTAKFGAADRSALLDDVLSRLPR